MLFRSAISRLLSEIVFCCKASASFCFADVIAESADASCILDTIATLSDAVAYSTAAAFCFRASMRCFSETFFWINATSISPRNNTAIMPSMDAITLPALIFFFCCVVLLSSSSSHAFSLVRRYTIALSKAGSYLSAHFTVGFCFSLQLIASWRSGFFSRVVFPC
ncbi:MAG: hypothetical protein BWY61_01699 [Firmicutes bacterium ADurb.Bin354]|nr:MAG: hypothetical protein BWY61_01699 [Firmicutes bacterium ADurb.Bin354]